MKAMRAQNKEKGTIEINVRERIKKHRKIFLFLIIFLRVFEF